MKPIKLVFSDFPGPCNPDAILSLLRQQYQVILDDARPDYVIFSVFGYRFLEFPEAVRIFFTGENVHPDFNLCDYAFGFDWMHFEDRYCRCPNYQLYDEFREIRDRRRTTLLHEVRAEKSRFCNFIYSNADAHPFRAELFHRLCQYRKVDSAGSFLNNTGFTPGDPGLGKEATFNKLAFQRECKFSIAVENSPTLGYTTEKLIHALAADTIPIYWGNPAVGREFNAKRIINCHEFGSLDEVANRVKDIDQDEDLFMAILSEPFFPNDKVPESLSDESVLAQFRHIFSQGKECSVRRNRYVWGKMYEQRRRREIRTQPTFTDWLRRKVAALKTT